MMTANEFETQVQQAHKEGIPVLFYTWFGPGCPVQKNWWITNSVINPYKSQGDLDEALFKKSPLYGAYRCGSCYQVMRNLNTDNKVKIINVAWASPDEKDITKAVNLWKSEYDADGAPSDRIPWVWFGDLIKDGIHAAKIWNDMAPKVKDELFRHLNRARQGRHVSAIITGKELLSLCLRWLYGGFTADTTVIPAVVNSQYNPFLMEKDGTRSYYALGEEGNLPPDGWSVANLHQKNIKAETKIHSGLLEVVKAGLAAGPTQNRNLGGIAYEGQPGVTAPDIGYRLVDMTDNDLYDGSALVTHDFRGKFTLNQAHNENMRDLDLIDVFFNYTPPTSEGAEGAKASLALFLEGCKDLETGVHETLDVYNAYRGPATLSAAISECFYQKLKNKQQIILDKFEVKNKRKTKDGRVGYALYGKDTGVIYGHFETRNPTPAQLRDGVPFRDVLGKEGFMLLKDVSLVKVWSGSWKAPEDYAVPVTPRGTPLIRFSRNNVQ